MFCLNCLQKWKYQEGIDNSDNYLEETLRMAQYSRSKRLKMGDRGLAVLFHFSILRFKEEIIYRWIDIYI